MINVRRARYFSHWLFPSRIHLPGHFRYAFITASKLQTTDIKQRCKSRRRNPLSPFSPFLNHRSPSRASSGASSDEILMMELEQRRFWIEIAELTSRIHDDRGDPSISPLRIVSHVLRMRFWNVIEMMMHSQRWLQLFACMHVRC